MALKPKQRIQLEKLRDEIITQKRGAIARYVEYVINETWSHSLSGIVDRLNKLEKEIGKKK